MPRSHGLEGLRRVIGACIDEWRGTGYGISLERIVLPANFPSSTLLFPPVYRDWRTKHAYSDSHGRG